MNCCKVLSAESAKNAEIFIIFLCKLSRKETGTVSGFSGLEKASLLLEAPKVNISSIPKAA